MLNITPLISYFLPIELMCQMDSVHQLFGFDFYFF